MALSYFLSAHALTRSSFWLDEGVTGRLAHLPLKDFLRNIFGREANAGFYSIVVRLWQSVEAGDGGVRRVSVLAQVMTVLFLYLIGRRVFSTRAGLFAAALYAVQPFAIHFAQEGRGYALAAALSTAGFYSLIRAAEDSGRGWWLSWAFLSSAACWSHFYAAFVVLAEFAGGLLLPAAKRRCVLLFGLLPLFVAATVWYLGTRAGLGNLSFVHKVDIPYLQQTADRMAGSRPLKWIWLAFLLGGLGALSLRLRAASDVNQRAFLALVPLWAAVPALIAVTASLTMKPMLVDHYLLVSLPAWALLAGQALDFAPYAPSVLVIFTAFCLPPLLADYRPVKPDWRSATGYVLRNSQAGDALAVNVDYQRIPFDYYALSSRPIRYPDPIAPAAPIASTRIEDFPRPSDAAMLAGHRRVWLFRHPTGARPPYQRAFDRRLSRDFVKVQSFNFNGLSVSLWRVRTN